MKQILFAIAVMMLTTTSCSKETTARLCGKVVSSRWCGVCAAQPSFIVDVYFPTTGETVGFPVSREYAKGEEYCR
jgi:hypothetical protein